MTEPAAQVFLELQGAIWCGSSQDGRVTSHAARRFIRRSRDHSLRGGAEREIVLVNGTLIAAPVFGVGFHWVSLTIAELLATAGEWALKWPPKYKARLSRICVRHVRYKPYYPACPLTQAPPAWVNPSVQG